MLKSILMTAAIALVTSFSSPAQTGAIKVEIPFDFVVGGARLPAGEYLVDMHVASGVISVRATDGSGSVSIPSSYVITSTKRVEECRLVFNRYGNRYFLSQVWGTGTDGIGLRKSRREIETASAETRPPEERILFAKNR